MLVWVLVLGLGDGVVFVFVDVFVRIKTGPGEVVARPYNQQDRESDDSAVLHPPFSSSILHSQLSILNSFCRDTPFPVTAALAATV